MSLRALIVHALLACLLPVSISATTLLVKDPGYLVIDGGYHPFDLPLAGNLRVPAELSTQGVDGFDLYSLMAIGSCQTGDDGNGSGGGGAASGPRPGLRLGQGIDAPRLDLRAGPDAVPAITLATCDGAVVLFARSASGMTTCSGAIGFPFRRGRCAAVDRADPGLVFFDQFERR